MMPLSSPVGLARGRSRDTVQGWAPWLPLAGGSRDRVDNLGAASRDALSVREALRMEARTERSCMLRRV